MWIEWHSIGYIIWWGKEREKWKNGEEKLLKKPMVLIRIIVLRDFVKHFNNQTAAKWKFLASLVYLVYLLIVFEQF